VVVPHREVGQVREHVGVVAAPEVAHVAFGGLLEAAAGPGADRSDVDVDVVADEQLGLQLAEGRRALEHLEVVVGALEVVGVAGREREAKAVRGQLCRQRAKVGRVDLIVRARSQALGGGEVHADAGADHVLVEALIAGARAA
jgi:hypothetical protein